MDGKLLPITTDLPPPHESPLELVRCNCSTGCSTWRCMCRKHGLECSTVCGVCKGQTTIKSLWDVSAAGAVKATVNPLMAKIGAMDKKVEILHDEVSLVCIQGYCHLCKKCPICLTQPKEIPYAVSCCNYIFRMSLLSVYCS